MYKTAEGITLHDPALCIGCGACMAACPYSSPAVDETSLAGETYSVLSMNFKDESTQPFWANKTALILVARVACRDGSGLARCRTWPPDRRRRQPIRKSGVVESAFCITTQWIAAGLVSHRQRGFRRPGRLEVGDSQVLKAKKSFRLRKTPRGQTYITSGHTARA
jgi:ferredoxin